MSRALDVLKVCVAAAMLLAAGCFSFTPSSKDRGTSELPAQDLVWPNPDTAKLESLRAATPEKIFRAKPLAGRTPEDITDDVVRDLVTNPRFVVTHNEMIDGVLVRTIRTPDDAFNFSALFMGFVPNGYALTPREVAPGRWRLVQARAGRSRSQIADAWKQKGAEPDPGFDELVIEEGIPFRVPEKLPPNCRGVMLHLWALASNEYERKVMKEMESRGWLIVDIKPGTGAQPDIGEEAAGKMFDLEVGLLDGVDEFPHKKPGESSSAYTKRLELTEIYKRQREITTAIMNLRNPSIPLCAESDVEAAAVQLGSRVDTALADNARGVKAALETALRVYPTLRGAPVVMIGFSAGAISTPTAAALVKPDAVVIIGGAANAIGIATQSALTHGGVRLACDGKPPAPALVRKLEEAYLRSSKLDAYHTAPTLSGVPVLVVDAGMDTWVPSEFGQLLYERLGRPDRLHMALGGHGMLFYFLPGQARWIADWIERAAPGIAQSSRNIR